MSTMKSMSKTIGKLKRLAKSLKARVEYSEKRLYELKNKVDRTPWEQGYLERHDYLLARDSAALYGVLTILRNHAVNSVDEEYGYVIKEGPQKGTSL